MTEITEKELREIEERAKSHWTEWQSQYPMSHDGSLAGYDVCAHDVPRLIDEIRRLVALKTPANHEASGGASSTDG